MKSSYLKVAGRMTLVSVCALAIPLLMLMVTNKWDEVLSVPRVEIFAILYVLFVNLNSEGSLYSDRILDRKLPWFYFPKKRLLVQAALLLLWFVITIGAMFTTWYFIKAGKPMYPQFIVFVLITSVLFLISVMGVSHAIKSVTQWRETVLKVEEMKREKLKSDFRALQNQVNPHFLFNSLNVLIFEIKHNPEIAETFTRKLSQVYRYVLESKSHELVSLKKELEFVGSYIYLHQVRMGNALDVSIDIDEDSLEKYLPPLTLQILVENAITHNVMTEEEPLQLVIEAREGHTLFIKNNFNPKQSVDSTKIGLSNIRARYALLRQDGLKIEQNETEFMVSVPILDERE